MASRDDFLNNHWKPYPKPLDSSKDFVFGRVFKVNQGTVTLFKQDSLSDLTVVLGDVEHPEWGLNISPELLVRGDVIGYDCSLKKCYLLSPCLQSNPMMFHQEVTEWGLFLDKVSTFFKEMGFVHTPTPTLVESPGVDHHIHFLKATGVESGRSWCLPTSPEIHLKKLLCQGYEQIYEIKKVFRDDFVGPHHRVEFTMVEWYRAYEGLGSIEMDIKALLNKISSVELEFESLSVSQAFEKYVGFRLESSTGVEDLFKLCRELEIHYQEDDDWNDLFSRIFIEKIEKNLGQDKPLFLWNFPRQQASLSQINGEGWCERFELYWKGVELANAYLEVNDPAQNKDIFTTQMELRRSSGFETSSLDQDFFKQTLGGMPPASGVALGLDRLHMLFQEKVQLN